MFKYFLKKLKNRLINLNKFESKICSQNGEDGIIKTIFSKIGYSKYYVEIGGGKYYDNTRLLRKEFGFTGLLLNSSLENLRVNLRKEFITRENINDLFMKYNVPLDFDLLSIDIDTNDWYVWNALDDKYRPRIVCIEYNAKFKPNTDMLIKYNPKAIWERDDYFGASMKAYYLLGRKKKYSLVCADRSGRNLFFVRDDLKPELIFKNVNDVNKLYTKCWSHPKDKLNREWTSAREQLGVAE